MLDIIGKRYWYFLFSLIVIIPGMIALVVWGLPVSIDFTGGSLLEVKFEPGKAPQPGDVVQLYKDNSFQDVKVQTVEGDVLGIQTATMPEETKTSLIAAMEKMSGSKIVVNRFDNVGPVIGAEVTQGATFAVIAAAIFILLYITYAFRNVRHAIRFGTAAIIAMFHDILVVLGIEALGGYFFGWQADALFLTALLTVIGFSVHDTIVVFDRVRENSTIFPRLAFEKVVNHSIIQTFSRSISTQLAVMLTTAALALFGGITIRHFAVIMLVGIFSGTYSSVFNAAPILVVWENREWKTWFRRKSTDGEVPAV
jgi:preprotein translocase subunit SecF